MILSQKQKWLLLSSALTIQGYRGKVAHIWWWQCGGGGGGGGGGVLSLLLSPLGKVRNPSFE